MAWLRRSFFAGCSLFLDVVRDPLQFGLKPGNEVAGVMLRKETIKAKK